MKAPMKHLTVVAAIAVSLAACSSTPERTPEPEPVLESARPAPLDMTQSSRGPVLTLDDMLFEFEEAELGDAARSKVAQAADYLRENPDRVAMIEGHTDHVGEADYNQWLSNLRATNVREAFLENGISVDRLRTQSYGETRPVASNDTLEGRQANRRVEIVFERKDDPSY